jgi:hypothetical protein
MASDYSKAKIPKALREQVWLKHMGKAYEAKCTTTWCQNRMTVFDFQVGHCVPESKGGATAIDNLVPLCSRCNLSMGSQFTTYEWNRQFEANTRPWYQACCPCFFAAPSRPTNGQGDTQVTSQGKEARKGNA